MASGLPAFNISPCKLGAYLMKCVIFDLDGVVFDVSRRINAALEEAGAKRVEDLKHNPRLKRRFWEAFLSPKYMHLDIPRFDVIDRMWELKRKGYKIIILTGRVLETQGDETIAQLKKYNVPYDEIYFRRKRDKRKDYEYKASVVMWLKHSGCEIVEIHEDSEEVANKLREIVPEAKIILY